MSRLSFNTAIFYKNFYLKKNFFLPGLNAVILILPASRHLYNKSMCSK